MNYSDVIKSTKYFRVEAEYYCATTINTKDSFLGHDIAAEIVYGTSNALNEDGIGYPVMRLNEIDKMFTVVPTKSCNTLSADTYNTLQLKKGDVIVCRTNGNPNLVGKCAVIMENLPYAFASYLFKVRTNTKISPMVLVAFLSCKYGRMEIDKNSMKGNQTNFSPAKFRDIVVPKFSLKFQNKIDTLLAEAYNFRIDAESFYNAASSFLLRSLGLEKCVVHSGVATIKSLSESFGMNGRLDAEYYQKKYEAIEIALNGKVGLFTIHDSNFTPKDKSEYKYIELADVGINGNITGITVDIGASLPTRARYKVKTGQVIVPSIEESLSSCALITGEYNDALCSTGFYVVDSTHYNPETLLVLFKSPPMQALLKKRCSGTILTAINKDEMNTLPLPQIYPSTQSTIAEKIQQSFKSRRCSEQLLEQAKRAVEIAIEDSENTAMAWLKEKGGEG